MTPVSIIQWVGGLLAFSALGIILFGVWRGTRRETGRAAGLAGSWLRSAWFYLASSALFFGIAYLGWVPLPWTITPTARCWMVALGSLSYFPGMCLILWGRLVLGKNYFVSTGFGAQLFKEHQLITIGPYAIMRHPMYAGLILAALGSLFLYFTWTSLYFACFAPLMLVRARREEAVLAAEFGDKWTDYCRRVPVFIPRIRKRQH
jgi:protein-S-isoprenylcysteine O-methyltransferase Ste14